MACSYPQWRIPWTDGLDNHPLKYRYQSRIHNDGVIIQRPEYESIKKCYPVLADKIAQIPCGKCIQCRIAYSREWANRCMNEYETRQNALFLTLTYDTAHLEFAPYVDPDSGVISTRPTLWPAHFTNFMKRLRAWCHERQPSVRQRFFMCGEYGDQSLRPHYHAIIYDLPPEFVEGSHIYSDKNPQAILRTCPALDKLWPYGQAVYGDVSWATCAYVARYIVKKRKGKDAAKQREAQARFFPDQPWIEEYVRMSRMPGLGRDYYDKKKDVIYETDEMFVRINDRIQPVRPAKYYDRLYDVENPQRLESLKKQRKIVAEQMSIDRLSKTDLNEVEYLALQDRSKEDQAIRLIRPSV